MSNNGPILDLVAKGKLDEDLIDIKNELIPILKENINISSYYSLCRMNHTYCMEEDLQFTNIELLTNLKDKLKD